jgi:S-adenosylmethionine hydrolase
MNKPNIVLQTDFGLTTGFVCSMYGVIKMVDDTLDIYDLNHEIRAFDMKQASYLLADTIPYWKPGTIFVSVVDPGVGTARRGCVAKLHNGSYLITPDNGTLTAVLDQVAEVRQIDENINRLKGSEKSGTFHGRDVFAYCAARLASGIIDFEGVGPAYAVNDCVTFEVIRGVVGDGFAHGQVGGCMKHFGGISTNIAVDDFEKTGIQLGDCTRVTIVKNGETLFDQSVLFHRSFGYVPVGEPILYNGGTSPYIALSLNQRSFAEKYLPDIFKPGENFADYKVSITKGSAEDK